LSSIRDQNQKARRDVTYIGIDIEKAFGHHWRRLEIEGLHYEVRDARTFDGYKNLSLACALFAVQFIPPPDKLPLLRKLNDGLVTGGALIIAEKVFASTSRIQDALTFPYYDFKLRQGFKPKQILDKERQLRGQMTLWNEAELMSALQETGFREIETIWTNFPFVALVALK
jgi:tRNA (cmo5U34)-methyltransferase